MISDDVKLNYLTDAAMTIFKYYEKGKGFYSGVLTNELTGRRTHTYNNWEAGLRRQIEQKLGRGMNIYERTVLALAVGRGPTPALTKKERKYSMEFLWDEEYPRNEANHCFDLMKVLTSF